MQAEFKAALATNFFQQAHHAGLVSLKRFIQWSSQHFGDGIHPGAAVEQFPNDDRFAGRARAVERRVNQQPLLAIGDETDSIARTVLESYANRLTHEKYAATHTKMIQALPNIFRVKPDSPALLNFLALVKWWTPPPPSKSPTISA